MAGKKVWFITGAGRGLGVDIAKAALAAGHSVVATGRDSAKVAAALGESDNLLTVKLDITNEQDAQAAVAACSRVERALEILSDDVPEHLRYAGDLRLRFRDASLDELGHHAEPPMTKDAVAGRIRRLLAMADKRAQDLGIPGTDANLPPDLDE